MATPKEIIEKYPNPQSTLGEKPYSAEGADKAVQALEAVGSFVPVLGQAIAAKDYYNAMKEGNSVSGATAAAQFIPGVGAINRVGKSIIKPSAYALKTMRKGGALDKGMAKAIANSGVINRSANIAQAGLDVTK